MPWTPPSKKQTPPPAGSHNLPIVGHRPTHSSGPIHPSLQGEQKPDKSPQGKRTYG